MLNEEIKIQLIPIATIRNFEEFNRIKSSLWELTNRSEKSINILTEISTVSGYCVPCQQPSNFIVDMGSGGYFSNQYGWVPNWRERLECPSCRMNNRQRLIATLVKQQISGDSKKNVYFMEEVTPIFKWALATFKQHSIIGSEYLSHEYKSGTIINGLHHEDIENLSFPDGMFDLIVSNDVFEHVPNPQKAMAECARVLVRGGTMLATIPFHSLNKESVTRAKIVNDRLENILPPVYHGNPVSSDGSLVFTDFGWDIIDTMRVAFCHDASLEIYVSNEFGHIGSGLLVFRCIK